MYFELAYLYKIWLANVYYFFKQIGYVKYVDIVIITYMKE